MSNETTKEDSKADGAASGLTVGLERLIREAGWTGIYSEWVSPTERSSLTVPVTAEQIARFAELVAAQERKACAKICEEYNASAKNDDGWIYMADEIRKRSNVM